MIHDGKLPSPLVFGRFLADRVADAAAPGGNKAGERPLKRRRLIFTEGKRVIAFGARREDIPLYGPELLLGGHTIGGSLYLLLAPALALWNDPEALRLLNQLLFLGMAVVLWWGLRDWVGPAGALFAVFALIASEAHHVALGHHWPIHVCGVGCSHCNDRNKRRERDYGDPGSCRAKGRHSVRQGDTIHGGGNSQHRAKTG